MPGLVLEGGGFRVVYTAGVLDALLDSGINFKYVIGVSAGATNAYSYVSNQRGRNWEVICRYGRSPRYLSPINYLTNRSIFGLNFVYGDIPNRLVPYDYEALGRYEGIILTGVTNSFTGAAEYYDQSYIDDKLSLLRASCAIPHMFPAIAFCGGLYYDGGIADPIPLRRAIADGHAKNLIVMTREPGYRKHPGEYAGPLYRATERKYPNMARVMRDRHLMYNGIVEMAERLEQEGDAVLLRPGAKVNVARLERNMGKLGTLYNAGYSDAMRRAEEIRALF